MKDFLKCGAAGWCMEIIFTSLVSLASGDRRLVGKTSLFMFPHLRHGGLSGPFLPESGPASSPAGKNGSGRPALRHGLRDMALIFTAEYVTGRLLRSLRACPWDYTGCRFSVDGLIRLDFAPLWFVAGLLFERITQGTGRGPADHEARSHKCCG